MTITIGIDGSGIDYRTDRVSIWAIEASGFNILWALPIPAML